MTTIFISHSTDNDDFVTQLAADLRAAGLQTWVDHENIKPADDWDETVEAALEATGALIVVLTPRATRSQNVKVEWSFFLDLGKPIYPVLLETCKVPFRLRLHQHVDFSRDPDDALKKLLAALGGKGNVLKPDVKTKTKSGKKNKSQSAPIELDTARQVDTAVVLSGHRDTVKSVAVSPAGDVLASASDDKNVRLWNTVRNTRIKVLIGHEGAVNDVAFNPDGSVLASASADRTVRLWDVSRQFGLAAFMGHRDAVNSVMFNNEGTLLASASSDATVRLWDVNRRVISATLEGHEGPVFDATFSPDGSILASGGLDTCVRLWHVAEKHQIVALEVPNEVRRIAYSPSGHLLALGLNGGGVYVFDTETHTRIGAIYYADYNATCVRDVVFSPDGALLAIGSVDGNIRLWKVGELGTQKRALRILRGHDGGLCGLAFSPDGRMLASASHDGTVRLWSVGG